MNEMQAHGLLIPVGSKPFEVWIDKNNSLAELQDLVNGNVDVLSVLGNGVDLWVNEEGLINGSKPNRAIYATKHMEEVGYLDQLTFGHPVKEGELYSLICGDFVAFGVDEEGEIASLPQETIDKLKETFADPSTGYKEYIHIKYGIEPDRYQLQNEHAAADKHEKSTKECDVRLHKDDLVQTHNPRGLTERHAAATDAARNLNHDQDAPDSPLRDR